jgi:hypothetical protein
MKSYEDFEAFKQGITLDALPSLCGVNNKDFAKVLGFSDDKHWNKVKLGKAPLNASRQAMIDAIIWMYFHEHSLLLKFVEYRLSLSIDIGE